MKLIYLPRPDRPDEEKIEAMKEAGIDVHVYRTKIDRNPNALPHELADMIKLLSNAPILYEYGVMAQPRGAGSYRSVMDIKHLWKHRKVVLWSEEVRKQYTGQVSLALPHVDVVLTNHDDQGQQRLFRDSGFKGKFGTMHGSADPTTFDTKEDLSKAVPEFDVVFFGKVYPAQRFPMASFRKDLVKHLASRFNMAVAGEGWEGVRNNQGDVRPVENLVKFVKNGKIVLGANQFESSRYYPERLWQSLASARCVVYRKVNNMELDFKDSGVTTFNTIQEAEESIRKILTEGKWQEHADRSRKFFLKSHTWAHHLKEALLPLYS